MKLRLPSKLVAAILAAASTTVLTTLCTGSSAYAEGEAPAAVKNGETLGNVMYIGDSITHGYNEDSWRWNFFKILTDNGISQTESGFKTGNYSGAGFKVGATYGGATFDNRHSAQSSGRAFEVSGRQANNQYDQTNIKNWLGETTDKTNGQTYDTSTYPVYDEAHGNAIDTFFLLIGTNDFVSQNSGNTPGTQVTQNLLGWDGTSFTGHVYNGEAKPDIEVIYETMLSQAPNSNIVMLTIPTTTDPSSAGSETHVRDIQAYNAVLSDWVTQKNAADGNHITLVDVNKGLIDVTNTVENKGVRTLFRDGLHPNAQGELIVSGNVAKGMGIGGRTAGLTRAAADSDGWTAAEQTSYTLSSGTQNIVSDIFSTTNGYTVDFTGVFGDGAANNWLASSNALSLTIGDGSNTGTLNLSEGYIMWGDKILYSQDNSSSTGSLRIAYHNGVAADNVAAGYYVWLGDMLIGEGLTATTGSGLLNGITLGANGGEGTISNLRWADTAYAPTTNFYMNEAAAYTAVQEVTRAISVAAGATENINVETIASSFSMGADSTLNIGKNVTVQSGATISVTDSMHLTIAEGAKLTLTGTDVGSDDYTKSTKFAYIMDAATGDGTIHLNGNTYVQLGNNASPFSTPHVFKTNYHVTGDMALQDWKHTDNGTTDNDNPWVIGNAEHRGSLTVDGDLWVSNGQHLQVTEYGSLDVQGNVKLGMISTYHYTGFLDILGGETTLGSIKFDSNNAKFTMSGGVLRVTNSNAFDTASVTNTTATTISAGTLKAEGNSWVFNRTATIGGADSTVTIVTDAAHKITLGTNGTTTTLAGDINVGAPGIAMMSEDGAGSSAQSGNLVLDGAYNGGAHAVNVLSGSSLAFGSNLAVADGSSITVNGETGAYVHLTQNTMPTRVTLGNAENWQGTVKLTNVALSGDSGKELSTLGNANSTVELTGVTGYDHNWAHTFGTQTANIRLTDEGDTLAWVYSGGGTSGTSKYYMNNTGKWSGEGTFKMNMTGTATYEGIRYSGDVSEWTGTFEMAAGTADLWFRDQADTVNATIAKSGGTLNLYVGTAADDKASVTFNKAVTASTLTVFGTATFKEALTLNSNATVADGNTVILAGNAATAATLEKFNGIGGTVQLGDGKTEVSLTLAGKQYTAKRIRIADNATLTSAWHSQGTANLSQHTIVAAGGTLAFNAGDVLGWGVNGFKSLTLESAEADKHATVQLDGNKQTLSGDIYMNGGAQILGTATGGSLELDGGFITATGAGNVIDAALYFRRNGDNNAEGKTYIEADTAQSFNVKQYALFDIQGAGSSLELKREIRGASWNTGSSSLVKFGEGKLILSGTSENFGLNKEAANGTRGGLINMEGTTEITGRIVISNALPNNEGASVQVRGGSLVVDESGVLHIRNNQTLDISGGSVVVSGNGKLQLGQISNTSGNLTINSGSLTATHIDSAYGGSFEAKGGTVEFTGDDATSAVRKDPATNPGNAVNVFFRGTETDNLVLKATQTDWHINKSDLGDSTLTLGNMVVDAANTHLISFAGAVANDGSSTITNNSQLKLTDFTIGADKAMTLTGSGVTTLGSTVTNSGTLSLDGTVNIGFAASSTGSTYTYGLAVDATSATGNGYKYSSANYQVVNSAGNAATAADDLAWQINGEAVSNATFDGKVLAANAARIDGSRYYINTAGDITFGADETAGQILFRGEQAGTTGTTTLTVDGAGSLTTPVLLSRVNNNDGNGGYNKDHILNLTLNNGAVVKIDNHSGGYAEANGNIAVNAGSTLVLATTDTLGYNDRNNGDQTKNLTLTGSADKTATVLLKNRQTMHTNLNLNGDTLITNTSDAEATGGNLAGLESLGGKITATGQNNIIDTRLMINWSMTIDVQGLDGELEVSGRTYNRTGGDKVTKTGAGTLTFSYSSESDKNVFHGNGLDVKEGTVNLNSDTLLNGALAIGAAASGSNPATTATVNIGEGAEIILHGGSITAGSTLNNAGTMVFESTSNAGNVDLFKAATGTGNAVIKTNMEVGNDVQLGLTGNLTVTNGATLDLATAKEQPTKLGWTENSANKGFSSVTLAGGILKSDSTLGIVRNLTTTENTTGNKIHFRDFPDSYSSNSTNFSGTTTLNSDLEIYTEYKSQLQFDHLTGSGNLSLTATSNRSDSGANVTINSVDGYTGTLKLLGSVPNNNKVKVTLDTQMNNTFTGIQLQNAELILVSRNDAAQRVHNLGAVTVTKASTIESASSQFHSQVDIASLTGSADLNLVQSSMVDHASVFNINGGDAGTYSGTLHIKQNVAGGHNYGRHAILNINDADVLSNAVISLEAVNNNDSRVGLGIDADSVTVKGITTADAYGEKIIFSGAGTVDTTGKNSAVYNGDGTERTLIINTGNNAETTYTANAVVKGNLNITKNGAGTQSFTGDMSAFNGSLTVTAGTLSFTNAVTVAAGREVTMEGGTLTFGNGATISGATTLAGTSLLNFTGGSSTMTGAITAANTSTVALSNSASLTIKGAADKALGNVTLNNGTLNLWSEGTGHTLTLNSLAVTGANNVIAASQSGFHGQVDIADLSSTAAGASLEFKNAQVDRASVLNINGGDNGAFDGTLHLHQSIGSGNRHIAMNVADADVLSKAVISMESENNSSAHVALGIAGDRVTVKGITTADAYGEKIIFSGTAALGAGVQPGTNTQNPDAYNGDGTTRTLVINTAGGEYTANATVKGNLNLTKNGAGTQTFSGDMSAFNGDLTVTDGTLAISNALNSTAVDAFVSGGVLNVKGTMGVVHMDDETSHQGGIVTFTDETSISGLDGHCGTVNGTVLTINVGRDQEYRFWHRYVGDTTSDSAVLNVNKLIKTGAGTQIIGGEYTEGEGLVIAGGIDVQQGILHMMTRGTVKANISVQAGATFETTDEEIMTDTAAEAMHYNGSLTLNGTASNTATLYYYDGSTYLSGGLVVNGYGKVLMNYDTTQFIGGLNSTGETPSVLTLEREKKQDSQNANPRYIVVDKSGDFNGTIKMNNKAANNAFGIVAAGEDAQDALAGAVVDFTDSTNNAIVAFVKDASMKDPATGAFINSFSTYKEKHLTAENLLSGTVAGLTGTNGAVYADTLTVDASDTYTYGGALNVANIVKDGTGTQNISGNVNSFNGNIDVNNGTLAFTGLSSDATNNLHVSTATVNDNGSLKAGRATLAAKDALSRTATHTGTVSNAVFAANSLSGVKDETHNGGTLVGSLLEIAEEATYTISDMTLTNSEISAEGTHLEMSNINVDAASRVVAMNESTLSGSNRLTLSAGEGIKDNVTVSSSQLSGLTLTSGSNLTIDLSTHGYAAGATDKSIFHIELSNFSWDELAGATAGTVYSGSKDINQVFQVLALGSTDTFYKVLSVTQGVGTGFTNSGITLEVQVPEPTTSVLSLLALAGMAARRRRH